MNQTHLKQLVNFPKNKNLIRLELAENHITGDQLKYLGQYSQSLLMLKLASNQICTFEEIGALSCLEKLQSLDLVSNPVTKL